MDQEYRDSLFIPSDNRENSKVIIAKRPDLAQVDGGRLAPSTFGTTLYAGTVLGYATSGGDSGFWKPYASGNTDGSQVASGILYEDAAPAATTGDGSEIGIVKEAVLFKDYLVGLDSTAITDLAGVATIEHGVNLIRIRA